MARGLDACVATCPDKLALTALQVETGATTRFTYRELARMADRIAVGLARLGVGRGDIVACQLPNWWQFTLTYLACSRIGAVMNPLMWVLRPLVRIKQAVMRGENINNAMTSARIYGDRQALVKRALSRLSLRQLEAALQKLADIDRTAKGVMLGDAWLEISRLCFGLARVRSR